MSEVALANLAMDGAFFGAVLGAPITVGILGARALRVVMMTWGLFVVFYVIFSIVVPLLLHDVSGGDAWNWFPESIAVTPALFLGWVPGLVVGLLAAGVRVGLRHFQIRVEVSAQRRRKLGWQILLGTVAAVAVILTWLWSVADRDLSREFTAEVRLADGQTFQRRTERSVKRGRYDVSLLATPADGSTSQVVWKGAGFPREMRVPLAVVETNGCAIIQVTNGAWTGSRAPGFAAFASGRGWRVLGSEQLKGIINRASILKAEWAQLLEVGFVGVRPPEIRVGLVESGHRRWMAVLTLDCHDPDGLRVAGIEPMR